MTVYVCDCGRRLECGCMVWIIDGCTLLFLSCQISESSLCCIELFGCVRGGILSAQRAAEALSFFQDAKKSNHVGLTDPAPICAVTLLNLDSYIITLAEQDLAAFPLTPTI